MSKGIGLSVFGFVVTLPCLGCSDDPAPARMELGGPAGVGGVSSAAGAGSGTAGSSASGASNAGNGTGGGGGSQSAEACGLQGAFSANADMQLQEKKCNTLGSFKTTYNVTINGHDITIEQFVEKVPMKGSVNDDCHVSVVVEAPAYREFNLQLAPATLTASGLYVEATGMDCRSNYDASLTFTAK